MRIAHVVHKLDVGGLERVIINLMKSLPRGEYGSSLYCLRRGGHLVGELVEEGFPVHELGKRDGIDWRLFAGMAREFRRESVDIVHCHNYGALFYGAVASRLARTAGTVYTAHGIYSARRLGELKLARLVPVDSVIAVSEDTRQAAIAGGRLDPDSVHTLPNGIDTDRFAIDVDVDGMRREFCLSGKGPVFGIVARLSPEKQHATLLEAMALLSRDDPGVVLVVVGDGPIRGDLERRARDLGVSRGVRFLGERSDVPELLKMFDVFVLSSRMEGLSLTLLEAMAAGLPVVATNVGGNPEVVVDGETGVLVESGDATGLAAAMKAVAADPTSARRMGEAGRRRVLERYSLAAMVKGYEAVYRGLLASG